MYANLTDIVLQLFITPFAKITGGLGIFLRYVFKPTLAEGKQSIISRTMGSKLVKMVYKEGGGTGTVDTNEEEQQSWSASDQEATNWKKVGSEIGWL